MLANKQPKRGFYKSQNNETSGPRFTTLSLVVICLYILFFRTDYLNDISLFLIRIGIITSVLALISKNFCKKRSIYIGFLLTVFVGLNFIITIPLLLPALWPSVGASSLVYIDNLFFFFAAFLALTYTVYELWMKEDTDLLCKVYILNPISLFVGLFCSVSFIFGQELAAWLFLISNFIIASVLFRQSLLNKKRIRFNFSLLILGISVIIGLIIRFIPEINSVDGISSSLIVLFIIMFILNLFFDSASKKRITKREKLNLNKVELGKDNVNIIETNEKVDIKIKESEKNSSEKLDNEAIVTEPEKTNDVITIKNEEVSGVAKDVDIIETEGVGLANILIDLEGENIESKEIDDIEIKDK